jgi:hypothetical protein
MELRLTPVETEALEALTAGMAGVNETTLSAEDAVVGAIEHGLSRLIEDFEVPDPAVRDRVLAARDALRRGWTRGNSALG